MELQAEAGLHRTEDPRRTAQRSKKDSVMPSETVRVSKEVDEDLGFELEPNMDKTILQRRRNSENSLRPAPPGRDKKV